MDSTASTFTMVFSAHAADFCSRAGGAIALATRQGSRVHVVDLSFGERGESEDYWLQTGSARLEDEAKAVRRIEAEEAATVLGASIEFLDFGDYPLFVDRVRLEHLASLIRQHRPQTVLTHWKSDPYNVDHEVAAKAVARAITMAAIAGFQPETTAVHSPALFAFEPTIPRNDDTGFQPTHYVDIDSVFDIKMEALARLRSQSRLQGMYKQWGEYRGAQARQWCGRPVRYAEAFVRQSAQVTAVLAP